MGARDGGGLVAFNGGTGGGRGTRWVSPLSTVMGWVLNRGAPSSGPQGWVLPVEELDMCLPALLCTEQPKQAKSSDKEGSKPVNVAFLPCEMCYELAVLNRRGDFKSRRGCGIIWLDSFITIREFPPTSPRADMTWQQEEKQGI